MEPASEIDPTLDLYGVIELARMQIAMQRELTALRAEKLLLTQQQVSGADRQAAQHAAAELRQARNDIAALRQDNARLQRALDNQKQRMTKEINKHREDCRRLRKALDVMRRSWSWRIGHRLVRTSSILRHPFKWLKGAA